MFIAFLQSHRSQLIYLSRTFFPYFTSCFEAAKRFTHVYIFYKVFLDISRGNTHAVYTDTVSDLVIMIIKE